MASCVTATDGSELPTLRLHGKNGLELGKGVRIQCVEIIGARDRNRTGTTFRSRDFKSLVSTNFTTRAYRKGGLAGALIPDGVRLCT